MNGAVPSLAVVCGLVWASVCAQVATGADPLPSAPAEPSWEKTTSQWFESIEPGGRIRVSNSFGNIYARFGGYEPKVEVMSTEQNPKAASPGLRVRLVPDGGDLDVSVERVPDADASRSRIDLIVFVPEGATLEAQTGDDSIEAKGIKGDVIASSVSGDIAIRAIHGRVQAKTSRGRIAATLETGVTGQRQELVTETGEIEVHVWEDANLEVGIATSGEISTDFSIDIEHRRFEEPGKLGTATLGQGGAELTLNSKQGRVRLLRLPRTLTAEE